MHTSVRLTLERSDRSRVGQKVDCHAGFKSKIESGEDLGASLALNIDGEMVVDLWGGWADQARTIPWTKNTNTNVLSTTKSMTSLAAL